LSLKPEPTYKWGKLTYNYYNLEQIRIEQNIIVHLEGTYNDHLATQRSCSLFSGHTLEKGDAIFIGDK